MDDSRRLRIMVCPHELVRGGSQIIAIQAAAELQRRGHEVLVYAFPGPLIAQIEELGLPYAPARRPRGTGQRPFALADLVRQIRRFDPDIVHAYEAEPAVAAGRAHLIARHGGVVTVASMEVPDFIPEDVPLLVGTVDLANGQRGRAGGALLLEPVVDTDFDAPGDPVAARAALGIGAEQFVVSVVGRLSAEHHKARGVVTAIEELSRRELPGPLTLIVAGTGDREHEVRAAAEAGHRANSDLTVRLEGDVADPRAVYDAADVTFGMGSSAIRAMAHAKPVIVQGLDGFCELLDERSVDSPAGLFGEGDTGGPSVGALIVDLLEHPQRRADLGAFGRAAALRRFSLVHAADLLEQVYRGEIDRARGRRDRLGPVLRSNLRYARFRAARAFPWLRTAYRRFTGRSSAASDDGVPSARVLGTG